MVGSWDIVVNQMTTWSLPLVSFSTWSECTGKKPKGSVAWMNGSLATCLFLNLVLMATGNILDYFKLNVALSVYNTYVWVTFVIPR